MKVLQKGVDEVLKFMIVVFYYGKLFVYDNLSYYEIFVYREGFFAKILYVVQVSGFCCVYYYLLNDFEGFQVVVFYWFINYVY